MAWLLGALAIVGCDASTDDVGDTGEVRPDSSADGVDDGDSWDVPGMRLVPAGRILPGSDATDCPFDDPAREVWVSAFAIDAMEVTNESCGQCVEAGACASPSTVRSLTRSSYFGAAAHAQFPVVAVDWARCS